MELKKRLYNRRKFKELKKDNINNYENKKVNRTQDEIRLYNRLYYSYVKRHCEYYQHYAKEYHSKKIRNYINTNIRQQLLKVWIKKANKNSSTKS